MKKRALLLTIVLTVLMLVLASCSYIKFTVDFDSDGGSAVESATVAFGEPVERPQDPVKEGYVFIGWYLGDDEYDFDKDVGRFLTLKAKWELDTTPKPETFTVTFDTDGGNNIAAVTVVEGEKITKPEDPTKSGYIFAGWFVGETAYDFATPVTADVELKAKWEEETVPTPTTYTVTFDSDGGSAVDAQTVVEGAAAQKPADPTKSGYTFAGWFVGEVEYDFTAAVTADVTLKAKWIQNTYTVTFDSDGGNAVEAQIVVEGSAAQKPSDPTKASHTFAGWFVGEVEYDFTAAVTADVTLKAKWVYALEWTEVIGTWTATYTGELYGVPVTQVYTFVFFADGTATATVNNDMMGMTYDEELVFTSAEIEGDTLVLTSATDSMSLVYEDGALVELANGMVVSPKSIAADIVGTWAGNEDYFGTQIPYTITVADDGTVSGSCDMFGYVYNFELELLDNKLVVSAMGAMQATLVYDGEKLVGAGIMGGALTMAPYVEPTDGITLDMLAGTWTGDETAYGMSFTYVFVINADGTGSAKYSSMGYETVMFLDKFEVVNNKLVVSYKNYEYDEDTIALEFSYADGKLVGVGIMAGELTLEKSAADDEPDGGFDLGDLAGTWTGSEFYDGVEIYYTVTITEDGDVTASCDMFGYVYDLVLTSSENGLVFDFGGMPVTLEYDGEKFVGTGAFESELILTKIAADDDEPVAGPALEDLAGKWTGTEVTAYGNYVYDITINADGTGTGVYVDEAGAYPSDMEITGVAIEGNTVTVTYLSYSMEYTIVFTYEDGVLSSDSGAMWGELTLEKSEADDEPDEGFDLGDLAGTWTGSEFYDGVEIYYTVTITEDGAVTGLCDMFGYPYEMELISSEGELVLDYMGAMQVTLEYNGENLVGIGVFEGELTLTKQA